MSLASVSRSPMNIGALRTFLDSLQSYSTELVQHLRSGQKLCHYTDLSGAIGIVTGDDLWLSSSRFSNDDEELSYGHRLVNEVLHQMEDDTNDDPLRPARLRRVRERMSAIEAEQVYICCFCQHDNLLSQWRGYTDNGSGVSIEFDPDGFTAIAGADSPHGLMRLWKVFYEPQAQRKIVRECVDYPYWGAATEEQRVDFIVDAVRFFLPTFKNADFSEEQERRLIFTPHPSAAPLPRFRSRRGLLLPYYSLRELAAETTFTLPVKHVLVGPGRHKELNVEGIGMMLAVHGRPGVPVEASTTPYRS